MISPNTIEEILSASNIITVIENEGVKVNKNGKLWKGKCPFHDEKTASFVIYENTQTYKCYGCGEGGNVISFLMKFKNMTYVEAIKYLAKKYQIHIEDREMTPEQEKVEKEKESFRIIYSEVAKFYHKNLLGEIEKDNSCGKYAIGRFNLETIKKWQIGIAPDSWQSLLEYMRSKGFKEDVLLKTDLFREKNKKIYDFFRNRLMFPIFDRMGRVIGFSGRDLSNDKSTAKYLNNGDSVLYNKGETLYGLNFAIPAIRKYDVAVFVEGNPDVVKLHEHGINNVVAACGTALTETQINTISKYTKNICLLYDGDTAGRNATDKNALIIQEAGLNVLVLAIPDGDNGEKQDPDTFFKNREHFKQYYLLHAVPYIIYLAKEEKERCKNNPTYAAKTAAKIAKMFFRKADSERTALVEQLSKIIKPKAVWKDALKELDKEKEKRIKDTPIYLLENGRTNEQNKQLEKYGFYVENNSYFFYHQKNGNAFFKGSNFIMEPLFHIESTVNAKRLYQITNEYGVIRVLEFAQKDLISIAAFKLKCESIGNFRFDAGEYGLAKIKAYLYEKTKTCKEVNQLGWQKNGFWAWSNGIVSAGEFQPISDDGICTHNNEHYYIPAMSSFYKADDLLFQFERKFKHIPGKISFHDYFSKFNKVYGDNAIIGIGFYIAALFRDVIVNYFKVFPILNLFGPKGTGKSQMAISLLQLFGNLPVGINMINSTIAAMADHVSHTRNAICHIDEYKNSVDYDKIEFMKGLFDGTGRNRMNMDKDKKKEMTAVDSAILLTGQEMTTADIALFSRVIFLSFTKSKFSDKEKLLYNELKNIESEGLTHITNEILTHRALFVSNFLDNYEEAFKEMSMLIEKNFVEDRIYRNWVIVLASIRTLKDVLKFPIEYNFALRVFAPLIERQNNETKANNEVSNFWDIFSYMVREGIIEKEYDYRLDSMNKLKTDKVEIFPSEFLRVLQVDMSRTAQLYAKHGKNAGQKLLPISTLKYYLENCPEYLGKKKVRLKKRSNLLQNRDSVKVFEGETNESKIETFVSQVYCFDYSKLDINIESAFVRMEDDTESIPENFESTPLLY